jgi:hypothetical protein
MDDPLLKRVNRAIRDSVAVRLEVRADIAQRQTAMMKLKRTIQSARGDSGYSSPSSDGKVSACEPAETCRRDGRVTPD